MTMDVDVVILGAGLAASAAAEPLRAAGLSFVVLDKSRGVGGRAATRRIDGIPVDHGAQFFTVRSREFAETVRRWQVAGICSEWTAGIHRYEDGRLQPPREDEIHARYACPEGMTALAKASFLPGDVLREHPVVSVEKSGGSFVTTCGNGSSIRSRAVLSTLPLPQTRSLLEAFIDEPNGFALEFIQVEPCLSAIVELQGPSPEWKGIQVKEEDTLSWLGADFSKRNPAPPRRFVVLHASAGFSAAHLDGDLSVAGRLMLARAGQICPCLTAADLLHVHRWRFARASRPLNDVTYWRLPEDGPLYLAGDAFGRGNIESAWLSGAAAARQLALELTSPYKRGGMPEAGTTRRGSVSPSTHVPSTSTR